MRITSILPQKNESGENVTYSVKSIKKESGCNITEVVFKVMQGFLLQDLLLLKHGTIFCQTKSLCKTGVHLVIWSSQRNL